MTTAEKLIANARQFFIDQIKESLKKKYPEITDEELDNMIAEYESVNPPPI